MRAYISGAGLLAVGVLIGVLIGSTLTAGDAGPSDAAAVTHTTTPTPSASTTAPKPSPSGKIKVPPTFVAGTASPAPGVAPVFNPNLPVTVGFGDSITFNADSWFRQLCLGGVVLQNCMNAGIRGNTTTQMLARQETDALIYQPAIVIVMGGTNDLKRHEKTKSIVSRLSTIVQRAQAQGAVTVICTIPPRERYGKQVLALNAAIREYATRQNVALLDFYGPLGTASGVWRRGMTKDGIHPSLRASDLMTALAEQQLPALLHPIKDNSQLGRLSPNR